MKRFFSNKHLLMIMGIIGFLAIVSIPFIPLKTEAKSSDLLETVRGYVKSDFVKKDVTDKQLEYGAIKGLLASLNDPYTRFIEPKGFEQMQDRLKGEFFGIGIQIGMHKNHLAVIAPIPGTPAEKAGLKSLDLIVSVDGKATDGMAIEETVSLIRGPKGTPVVLEIRRADQKKTFKVTMLRDTIRTNAVDKQEIFQRKEGRVGYIRMTTFENQYATREMQLAIQNLHKKNMEALIVDLRNNGGGLLKNAIGIGGLFMENVPIVHTVDREKRRQTQYVSGTPQYAKGPLIILVNEGSASASEILAGAVKDNHRGTIVGKHTFGKASVQKIIDLEDHSAVLLTIQKYLTPNGIDITEKGITVDVQADIPSATIKAAQKPNYTYSYDKDPQLQKAIAVALQKIKETRSHLVKK